jgi:radical SAM protein with 4Fe4S-binding SPASM domain
MHYARELENMFVSIRREKFGGLMHIRDRFLLNILKFSKLSFRVIELLVLNEKIGNIINTVSSEFKVEIDENDVEKLIKKLNRINVNIEAIAPYVIDEEDRFLWNAGDDSIGDKLRSPLHVYWHITNACNLRCKHCIASSGESFREELSDQAHERILDELISNKVAFISFTGGEPLINKNRLFRLAKKARKNGIALWLATNAILATPEIAAELADIGFNDVQISIDGFANHDLVRGHGALEKTIAGIKNLQNAGMETTLCMAVMRPCIKEVDDVINWSLENNVQRIKFIRFLPLGRGAINTDLEFSKEEEIEVAKKLFDLKNKYEGRIRLVLNDSYPSFAGYREDDIITVTGWDCCSARVYCYINSKGEMAPCACGALAGLYGGNVMNDSLQNIWNNSDVFKNMRKFKANAACSKCSIWEECKGGCKVSAYVYHGDISMPDSLCRFYA